MEEKKTARDLWVEAQIEFFISKMKPFYTESGLNRLNLTINDMLVGRDEVGTVQFYFGKYGAVARSKKLYHMNPEDEPTIIRNFLSNFYKLVKAVSEHDYETAKKAYDEEFALFAHENKNNLQGPDFLCHHVIPGCKAKGFSKIFPVNVNETKLQKEAREKVEFAEKKNEIIINPSKEQSQNQNKQEQVQLENR